MVRLYGKEPYQIILVHGGPGAVGSLKNCAAELSSFSGSGVVEALQSKYSIDELIEELRMQIVGNCRGKVNLADHSWGAWSCLLFAAKYTDLCEKVILIGCSPLVSEYASEINLRRMKKLSDKDKDVYRRVLNNCASAEDIKQIPNILKKADNYCPIQNSEPAERTDNRMYNSIWGEASVLRAEGKISEALGRIKCKIFLIHGKTDPHGVINPMRETGAEFDCYVLDKCGHSPFIERYAKNKFYKVLTEIINTH